MLSATAAATDTPVLARVSFWFSARGRRAACFTSDGEGSLQLEAWSFEGRSPRWLPLPLARAVTVHDQPLPLDDGRILLCRNGIGIHEITVVEERGGMVCDRILTAVDSPGLRLLPAAGHDHLGIAISCDGARSAIWRLSAHPPHLVRLAELSGVLYGGVWLDDAATLLGVNRVEDGSAKAVAVNLEDGSWTSLLDVSARSNDRLLLCSPRSGLLVVSTDAAGQQRLGWSRLGGREPVRFPQALNPTDQAMEPLTLDERGQRVLVRFDEGVRSRLAIYTPTEDRLEPVDIPPGRVTGTAHWAGSILRFPFSSPSQSPCVASFDLGGGAGSSLSGHGPSQRPWADAHVEWLEGAAGPVEAIVYGGEGWRTSKHPLLALHGGPVDAWRFEFEPSFQRLVAAGIAIIAPNQRGSSGYGAAHAQAIHDAWGGPDVDDIRCIARKLAAERRALGLPGLMLWGSSYGGFLALLAASCEPGIWSRCVVLPPFLSGPRLYREATPAVRGLLEQLGGLGEQHHDIGPRDVVRLCPAIRAKLLIVHGERDDMIPVSQSRVLTSHLRALGRREGVDFEYVEVPGGRHELLTDAATDALRERLVRFLLAGQTGHPPGWHALSAL